MLQSTGLWMTLRHRYFVARLLSGQMGNFKLSGAECKFIGLVMNWSLDQCTSLPSSAPVTPVAGEGQLENG